MKRKWKNISYILSVGFCSIGFLFLLKVLTLGTYPDFSIYYFASQDVLNGQNPYLGKPGIAAFIYPPISFLIFIPFSFFQLTIAGKMWVICMLVLLISSLILLYKITLTHISRSLFIFLCGIFFLSFPTKFSLGMGQVSPLLFFLVTLLLYLLQRKKTNNAAGILGMTLSIKFFPLFLLLHYFVTKQWRRIFIIGVTCLAATLLPLCWMKFTTIWQYWTQIFPSHLSSIPLEYYNQSFSASLARFIPDKGSVSQISLLVLVMVLSTVVLIVLRRKSNPIFDTCLYMLVSLLFTAVAWQHYYIFYFIPWVVALGYIIKKKLSWHWRVSLGISFLLVAMNLENPGHYLPIIQIHTFIGGVILFVIMLLLKIKKYV